MYKMYLVIGDWSGDGHSKYDKVLVHSNKRVEQIQKAYRDSCRLTGVSFHEGEIDYKTWEEDRKFQISTEYESGLEISDEVKEALKKHGLEVKDCDDIENELEYFTKLWFDFVRLSLPDLKWQNAKDDIPCINGFWQEELNEIFGYGLYN